MGSVRPSSSITTHDELIVEAIEAAVGAAVGAIVGAGGVVVQLGN
jgi:hypothetical protein